MDKTLRSILWALVSLVLLSSFSAGWFFVAKERLYDEYMNLEDLFKTSIERSKRETASLNKKNMELSARLESVEQEMNALESKNKEIKARYEEAMEEKKEMSRNLAMLKKTKVFLEGRLKEGGSDGFTAGLLKEKVSAEVALKRLKDSLVPREREMTKLKQDNMDLEVTLSKTKEEKESLKEKLEDAAKVAQILSRDLLRARGENEKRKRAMEDAKVENKVLKGRLAELEGVSDKFNAIAAEKDAMESKIAGLMRDKESKDEEIDKLRLALGRRARESGELRAEAYHAPEEVELPPIVLKAKGYGRESVMAEAVPEGIRRPVSLIKGRIVSVNREHNFVVIDAGKQDGIRAGNTFKIYRGDNLEIGSIEVIQTRDRIAAADIKDLKEGFHVEINDVIQSNE